MSEVSDIQKVPDAAEKWILANCEWDHCPSLEPKMVNETEPEVGELSCLRDDTVRNGKMVTRGELKEACEPAEKIKPTRANPP